MSLNENRTLTINLNVSTIYDTLQINEDFFKVEKISAGFSQYLPNLIFERKDDEAQWS